MSFNFPNTPTDGTLFTDATSGAQYVYKSDPGAWMQTSAAQIKQGAETRNRVCNPAMTISQELGDTGSSAAATYPLDQWTQNYIGAPLAIAFLRTASNGGSLYGSPKLFATQINTPKASLAAGDYVFVYQLIEGLRVADLQWGTAKAKPIVVRFSLSGPAGTYGFWLANGAGDRTYVKNIVLAGTYVVQEFVLAIPGDTTGTWPVDNTLSLQLGFTYACGSNFITATTGWQAGQPRAVTGITNNAAVANSVFLGDVGLYADPQSTGAAPPFQVPDYAVDLRDCQRYWARVGFSGRGQGSYNAYVSAPITFPATMRVAPAVAVTPGGTRANVGAAVIAPFTNPDGSSSGGRADVNGAAAGDYYTLDEKATLNARM